MYSCDGKAEFSEAIPPVLSVTSFWHADLVLNEHFLLLSMLQIAMVHDIFVEIIIHLKSSTAFICSKNLL